MAIKNLIGKSAKAEETKAETEASARPRVLPVARTVAPATAIDATTQLTGKLRCKETLRIDGRVKGEVRSEKTVIVGEGAVVEAAIQADAVVIAGEVKGDIAAKRKITLERTARVAGELCTPGIVIEEGAKVEGRIVIGADERSAANKQPASTARTTAPSSPAASSNGRRAAVG